MNFRFLIRITLFACSVVAAYCAQQTIVLPPVSMSSGETAEINITSLAAAYPGWGSDGTCQGSATFYGADGSVLGSAASFTVGQNGQIFSTQLASLASGNKAPTAVIGAKLVFSAMSNTYDGAAPPMPECAVGFSLIVFNATTGVTSSLVTGEAAQGTNNVLIVGATPALPCLSPGDDCEHIFEHELTPAQVTVLPPVGIGATETAQVDITSSAGGYVGSPAPTCSGSITFYGNDGSLLDPSINFTMTNSTQIFSAALPYTATGEKALRSAISARIALTATPITVSYPASALPPCVAAYSLKTLDTATGVTHGYATGQTIPTTTAAVPAISGEPDRGRPQIKK